MKNQILSIVIPCKNEAKFIGDTLAELLKQTAVTPQTPIIIADAGSTDNTLNIIDDFKPLLNIKVVPGGLPATGRNIGASYTDSEFILFMDADITPGEPGTILEALTLAREKKLDLVSTHIHAVDGNCGDKLMWRMHGIVSSTKLMGAYATGMFILMRSETFKKLGGFDEEVVLGEDWELTHQIPPQKFAITKSFINTTSRRFVSQGYMKTFYQYVMVATSGKYRHRDHKKYFEVKYY